MARNNHKIWWFWNPKTDISSKLHFNKICRHKIVVSNSKVFSFVKKDLNILLDTKLLKK